MAGEVRGDASDRWCGATSRTLLLLTRRAVTRNGPHGGRTGAKRPLSMGNGERGRRRSALGMRCSVLRLSGGAGAGGTLTPHTTHHYSDTRTRVWSRLGGWKLGGYRDYRFIATLQDFHIESTNHTGEVPVSGSR